MTVAMEQSGPDRPIGRRIWLAYAPLLALWAAYYAAVWITLAPFDKTPDPLRADLLVPFLLDTGLFLAVSAVIAICGLVFLRGEESRVVRTRRLVIETPWVEIAALRLLPGILFLYSVLSLFMDFKPHIPEIAPFSWDPTFTAWDRILFLGQDGWEVTHAIFSADWASYLIDGIYVAWLYIVLAAFLAAACARLDSRARLACLMSYALNWAVAGTLLAVIFSSAGPIFLERMFGDPTFAAMQARLEELHDAQHMWAIFGSELLWQGYVKAEGVPAFGISAFPSLHVAMAATIFFYAKACGPIRGALGLLFLLAILIGSVHLGWHYLVDGLASLVIAWVNWRVGLSFAEWWLRESR